MNAKELINYIKNKDIFSMDINFNDEIKISTHWIEYEVCGSFEISYCDSELLYIWNLYELFVIYEGRTYSYSDFFQKYDEITNGYKNYKNLDSLVSEWIINNLK